MERKKIVDDLVYQHDGYEERFENYEEGYEFDQNRRLFEKVKDTNDLMLLHDIAKELDWECGFKIPEQIINNKNCDLGTALLSFYLAGGDELLNDVKFFEEKKIDEDDIIGSDCKTFIINLYYRILKRDFKTQIIKYDPEWTKVQIYQLRKANPTIDEIFIEGGYKKA